MGIFFLKKKAGIVFAGQRNKPLPKLQLHYRVYKRQRLDLPYAKYVECPSCLFM